MVSGENSVKSQPVVSLALMSWMTQVSGVLPPQDDSDHAPQAFQLRATLLWVIKAAKSAENVLYVLQGDKVTSIPFPLSKSTES